MTKAEAIAYFGNANRLAKALGIYASAVSRWGNEVPPLRVYQIKEIIGGGERISNEGALTRHRSQP